MPAKDRYQTDLQSEAVPEKHPEGDFRHRRLIILVLKPGEPFLPGRACETAPVGASVRRLRIALGRSVYQGDQPVGPSSVFGIIIAQRVSEHSFFDAYAVEIGRHKHQGKENGYDQVV